MTTIGAIATVAAMDGKGIAIIAGTVEFIEMIVPDTAMAMGTVIDMGTATAMAMDMARISGLSTGPYRTCNAPHPATGSTAMSVDTFIAQSTSFKRYDPAVSTEAGWIE